MVLSYVGSKGLYRRYVKYLMYICRSNCHFIYVNNVTATVVVSSSHGLSGTLLGIRRLYLALLLWGQNL